MTPEGMQVCHITSKSAEEYRIILNTDIQYSREGFFTLVLFDKLGKIMTIAFSIDFSTPKPRLLIGSLQATSVDGLNRIRYATHEMYGLQPRLLLIHLVKVFGHIFGIEEIEAISDNNHVYNSLRYRRRLKNKFQSYDTFWGEIGTQAANGNFNIDTGIHRKSIEEYPSKKRSEYKKRFALLDEIEANVQEFSKLMMN